MGRVTLGNAQNISGCCLSSAQGPSGTAQARVLSHLGLPRCLTLMVRGKVLEMLVLARPPPRWAGNAMQSQFLFFQAVKAEKVGEEQWVRSARCGPKPSSKAGLPPPPLPQETIFWAKPKRKWPRHKARLSHAGQGLWRDGQASSDTKPTFGAAVFPGHLAKAEWHPDTTPGIPGGHTMNRSCLMWGTPIPKFHLQGVNEASLDAEFSDEGAPIQPIKNWTSQLGFLLGEGTGGGQVSTWPHQGLTHSWSELDEAFSTLSIERTSPALPQRCWSSSLPRPLIVPFFQVAIRILPCESGEITGAAWPVILPGLETGRNSLW